MNPDKEQKYFSIKEGIRQKVLNISSSSELRDYLSQVKMLASKHLSAEKEKELLRDVMDWIQQNPHLQDKEESRKAIQTMHSELSSKDFSTSEREEEITDPAELERILNSAVEKQKAEPLKVVEAGQSYDFRKQRLAEEQRLAEKKETIDLSLENIISKKETAHIECWEILEKLGSSGFGVVHQVKLTPELTKDKRLRQLAKENPNATFALKMLHSQEAEDSTTLERFRRERKSLAKINHPNVVRLYDFGKFQEQDWYVMEELKELEKHYSPLNSAVILLQAASGVKEMHRHGMIHRDIKPSNLMITKEGIAKIIDPGIAKDKESKTLTQTGDVFGTPAYMSPNQVRSAKHTTEQDDVYSLGATLYKLVTGKAPYSADKIIDVLYDIKDETKSPDFERIKDPALREIIKISMRHDRESRYEMNGFLDALKSYIEQKRERIPLETIARELRKEAPRIALGKKAGSFWRRKVDWLKANPFKSAALLAAFMGIVGTSVYFASAESSEEIKRRAGLAKYQPIAALYKDAINDKNPESSLAKLIILAEQTKEFRKEHPNIKHESIEDMLSTTGQKIPILTKTVQKNKTEKELKTSYNGLKRLAQLSLEDETNGKYGKAASGYEKATRQAVELKKLGINQGVRLSGIDEFIENLGKRYELLTEKVVIQKYDSQISTIQENFILKEQYPDARSLLEKLLAELRKEPNQEQLSETRDKITKTLDDVRIKLKDMGENKAFAPLKEKYEEIYALEKENKLIDAKTLYEKLIKDCTEAGDVVLIKELLAKIKTRPEQLHKQILDYALEGDFANLDQSHKEVVEYTIDSLKQRYGADPRKLVPARDLSKSDLEERIKHHEVILKEMCRWKVMDTVKTCKGSDWFPRYTTGNEWGCENILENPTIESSFYTNLLSLAYQITNDETFAEELKSRVNILKKIKSNDLKNKGNVDYFPLLFNEIFDLNGDNKKITSEFMEEFISYVTKDGFFKYPSGEKWYIDETTFDTLIKVYNFSKNKNLLSAMNRIMKNSIKNQYDPKNKVVYLGIEKKGRIIKPTHKGIYSEHQIRGLFAYKKWYDFIKDEKFKTAAKNIADNYMNWVKQHTTDLVPPDLMTVNEAENNKKNTKNVKSIDAFIELANLTGEKKYLDFAQRLAHTYISKKYLNTSKDKQGIMLHSIIGDKLPGVSTIDTDFYFLNSLQKLIEYEKHQLQLKQKQEQKQPEQEKQGSMHESFFRRDYCRAPREMKPANIFKPVKYMIPRRVAI